MTVNGHTHNIICTKDNERHNQPSTLLNSTVHEGKPYLWTGCIKTLDQIELYIEKDFRDGEFGLSNIIIRNMEHSKRV